MQLRLEEMIKTDEGCKQLLFLARFRKGKFKCESCKFKSYAWCPDKKATIKCAKCAHEICLIKGTFFARLRTPLKKVLGIIYGYTEGDGKSAAALAREFEVAYSTVWRLLHRLRKLFEEIYQRKSQGVTVHCSDLTIILFKRSVEPEQRPTKGIKPNPILTSKSQSAIATTTADLRNRHQGIARKYAQPYAAEQFFRRAHYGRSFLKLVRYCLGFRPVSTQEIENYTSPDLIVLAA